MSMNNRCLGFTYIFSSQVGEVSYHDYWGILIDEAEKESIKNDLGPTSMVCVHSSWYFTVYF